MKNYLYILIITNFTIFGLSIHISLAITCQLINFSGKLSFKKTKIIVIILRVIIRPENLSVIVNKCLSISSIY